MTDGPLEQPSDRPEPPPLEAILAELWTPRLLRRTIEESLVEDGARATPGYILWYQFVRNQYPIPPEATAEEEIARLHELRGTVGFHPQFTGLAFSIRVGGGDLTTHIVAPGSRESNPLIFCDSPTDRHAPMPRWIRAWLADNEISSRQELIETMDRLYREYPEDGDGRS